MTNRILTILFLVLTISLPKLICAQDNPVENWDSEKIKGVRQFPYPSYTGSPYLTDDWCPGKVELASGETIDSLFVRYSSFEDELIYYNKATSAQINIDKTSLKGFEFVDDSIGITRKFRKLYFENYMKSDRFFEVLYEGPTNILAFRKVSLNTTMPYHDKNGILKNMEYSTDYQLYFYSPEKGYSNVKAGKNSFLSKFEKASQKSVKKILRKRKITIEDEYSLVQAWQTIEKEGYKVLF